MRAGKLLMTVFKTKGDTVTCHLEVGHTIQEKTFHRDELTAGGSSEDFDQMSDAELSAYILGQEKELMPSLLEKLSDAELQSRIEKSDRLRSQLSGELQRRTRKERVEE